MDNELFIRSRSYQAPVEDKGRIRRDLQESVASYLESGGKIERVGVLVSKTITRADIKSRYKVTDKWIDDMICGMRFPMSLTATKCNPRDKDRDKFDLRQIETYFDHEQWRNRCIDRSVITDYKMRRL